MADTYPATCIRLRRPYPCNGTGGITHVTDIGFVKMVRALERCTSAITACAAHGFVCCMKNNQHWKKRVEHY